MEVKPLSLLQSKYFYALPPHLASKPYSRGAWVAQLVENSTLDLSSGLDFRVLSSGPTLGSTLGMEPT